MSHHLTRCERWNQLSSWALPRFRLATDVKHTGGECDKWRYTLRSQEIPGTYTSCFWTDRDDQQYRLSLISRARPAVIFYLPPDSREAFVHSVCKIIKLGVNLWNKIAHTHIPAAPQHLAVEVGNNISIFVYWHGWGLIGTKKKPFLVVSVWDLFRRSFCTGMEYTMSGAIDRTRIHNYLCRTASRSVCLALRLEHYVA